MATKPLATIGTVTPQQALEKRKGLGVGEHWGEEYEWIAGNSSKKNK
ncbi:hypothetical protein [Chryseobacterium sp. ERMR1:04]|nr:hypothetical protein [Chryseobacterium sp. ERMR1:04]